MSEYNDFESYDNDWDADPFEGDMDFDMDFDNPGGNKGFLRSVVSGFLDGVVERTVGSTDAKINTLQRVLPPSWNPTFRNLRELHQRGREAIEELKNNSFTAVQDLQYLAARAAKAAGDKLPNKISEGLNEFSRHDFSSWEKQEYERDDTVKLEETSDDEIKALLAQGEAESMLSRETFKSVGKQTIGMMTEIGGRSIAGMHSIVQTNQRTNQLLEHLLDYQRRVQQRNDQLQINIAARQYLASGKFYKFVEASNHRMIAELKLIAQYSQQSDYEKTTTSQALKRNLRETVFNTAKSRFGGIADYLTDRVGKDAREDIAGDFSDLTSNLRMVAEMTEGMPINVGSMLGNAAAGIFLTNLPKFIESGKGQEYLVRFTKKFPKLAKWAKDAYIRIGDLGHVANYATGNLEEIANTLARFHHNGVDTSGDEDQTYEEYVDSLPKDAKPAPKAIWYIAKKARKTINNTANGMFDETWSSSNTKYSLSQRTLKDSHEQALWTRRSDRTLNEEIPRWFSMLHLSLEKIRTGNDKLQPLTYDYVKSKFVTEHQKAAMVTNAVFDRNSFAYQATSALNLAGSVDEGGLLSKEAKEAFAMQLVKDSDSKHGFNPYNYFNMEDQGHSKEIAEAVKKTVMSTFGITDAHIDEFLNSDTVRRGVMATYMPTEKGRRLLPGFADASRSLGTFMPDIAEGIDIHKSAGFYEAMKQAGIIAPTEYGEDDISENKFWDLLGKFIKNPELKNTVEVPKDAKLDPTRSFGGFAPNPASALNAQPKPLPPFILGSSAGAAPKPNEPVPVKMEGLEDLIKSLDGLKDIGRSMDLSGDVFKNLSSLDFKPIGNSLDLLVKNTGDLLQLAQTRNETLTKIQEGLPTRKRKQTQEEENDIKSGTARIIDKIKEFSFKDFYNKAVDTVLRNEPLILGGLLGGLAGYALHNPKAAALVAGGAMAAAAYGKLRSAAKARTPEDSEDLYEEGSDEPILEARRLQDGQYYDLTKNKIIKSWKEISGSIRIVSTDAYNGTIIGARKLAKTLFTAENKEVFLGGLNKVREWLTKAFKWVDPWGRAVGLKDKVTKRFYQMDVYKEGADSPTLSGKSFDAGAYWKKDAGGNAVMITGWNEIDGPVYDREGNVLITQEDFDRGLVTSMGVSINKMGTLTKKFAGWGLDALRVTKDKVAEYSGKAYDKSKEMFKADYTPITNSIDRIYYLMLKHWGYQQEFVPEGIPVPPPTPTPENPTKVDPTKGIDPDAPAKPAPEVVAAREEEDQNPAGAKKHDMREKIKEKMAEWNIFDKEKDAKKPRLNSFADKEEKRKEKKAEQAQDALINMAGSFGFGDKEKKPERAGLFGLLTTMIGGVFSGITAIGTFFTKTLWSSVGRLVTFANVGIKILPAIFTGITAIAKGVMTLVQTKSITSAGTSILDTIMDNKNENPETRKKRKEDRATHRKKPSTKFGKAGIGAGVALASGMAIDSLIDMGIADEDGLAANAAGAVETAATVYGAYQLASGAAALAGVELGAVALGVGTTVGGALLTGAGMVVGGIAAALSSPFVLGAIAIGAVGYGLYKLFQAGKGTQLKLRLTQYGVSDVESTLAENVVKAEQMLEKFVVIGNGRASISKDADITGVFKLFVTNPQDKAELAEVFTWFNGRFKPVFLTYMACLDAAKFKSMQEFDESTDQNVYNVAKQAHSALGGVMPYPYTIVAKVDKDTPIMAEKQTVIRVNSYLAELKKYVDRKTDKEELKPVEVPAGVLALEREKKQLEESLDKGDASVAGPIRSQAKERLDYIDRQLSGMSTTFVLGKQVQAVYIKDLLPDDRAMDLLTAIRLACYGNDEDVHWRIEAVLRLERYCEPLFVLNGSEVVFNGDIPGLFGIFRTAFRLKRDEGEDWCKWFRDRFAPVMRNYVQVMANYRKGNPGVVWKSLSVTARYEIAQALVQTMVHITDKFIIPIWNVRVSPFLDSRSPDKPDKVDRMLKLLSDASTQAKIRDPEKEAGKTNTQSWAKEVSPHKPGGGFTPHAANVQTADQYKSRRDVVMGGQFGTNTVRGAGTGNIYSANGNYGTPQNQFGYKALTGDSDTSHLDMSGVQKDSGSKDSGVKVPRKLAEQLMIREMLKQGFTDPRAIAEMLALTNYETGGYSRTVENLKYKDPARLMKTFREVTSLEQAQQLVSMGEVAIGNTVYGGGKGRSIGNTEPGDGYKYRGRGFVQLTGKANYAKTGASLGIDLVNKPELLSEDPNVMAQVAVDFYKNSKLLQSITQDGDFGRAARGLNGGNALPGMPERHKLYLSYLEQLGKGELKADEESAAAASKDAVGSAGLPPPSAPAGGGTGPMIGGPGGTPPLGAGTAPGLLDQSGGGNYSTPPGASGGGSPGYGGSLPPGGGDTGGGGGFVSSGANSDNSGLRLKSSESVAGGDAHPGVKRLGQLIQTNVRTFKQITAMNDLYHKQKKPNSKHAKGLAIDFTLTDGVRSSDQATAIVKQLLQQAGLQPNEFLVLNEYKRMSAGATGGHIHAGFNTVAAADKFNQAAGGNATNGQDTTAGGGPVQPKEEEMAAPPQMGVEQTVPRGMESPGEMMEPGNAPPGGAKPNIPGPKPPQSGGNAPSGGSSNNGSPFSGAPGAGMQQGGGNNQPAAVPSGPAAQAPQAQQQQQTASNNPALERLLTDMIENLAKQGDSGNRLLGEAVKQLIEMNRNMKPQTPRVPV
jgi:predicted chitinase